MASRTSQEQFDRQAPHYNQQWNAWNERSLEWLMARARLAGTEKLLDVATGTGFTALAFAPRVAAVTGLDVSEGMLGQARRKAAAGDVRNVEFRNGAAESIPFPDGAFDIVVCRVAAHHFVSITKFLSEAHRVLAGGGRLLVADTSVPDAMPEVDAWQNRVEVLRDPSHVRNYSPSEWRAMATAAGFTVEEVELVRERELIELETWLEKAGCSGEHADAVRRLFAESSPETAREFSIGRAGDGSTVFQWLRVALAATAQPAAPPESPCRPVR